MMPTRITTKETCGNCYRHFNLFETVNYLGIDNDCYCTECREKLAPKAGNDLEEAYGGWVPTLFVGGYYHAHGNIIRLIGLWNDKLDEYDQDRRIEIKEDGGNGNPR